MARTNGNIIVEQIKVGDIHYEYFYGKSVEVRVKTLPVRSESSSGDFKWEWTSEDTATGKEVFYLVTEGYEHYGPTLYDYKAYTSIKPNIK